MRYFKKEGSVHAFDDTQYHLITGEYIEMSAEEIEAHINPQSALSNEEKLALYTASLRPLTRRQFKLALLANSMLDQIDVAIASIKDDYTRSVIQIEYGEGTEFHRTSESVIAMCGLLKLSTEQVNEMWEYALTL
ncbi:hypothetical protein [Acinetobacter sp. YH01020]|uniref:hypothetical protein n=1 Tax=Acinetobacter sp. YH01020 TaxID=2601034 RepID=UPI0015D43B23|nr:hypothetical protein [Acinetobacter sp. YH01020]